MQRLLNLAHKTQQSCEETAYIGCASQNASQNATVTLPALVKHHAPLKQQGTDFNSSLGTEG